MECKNYPNCDTEYGTLVEQLRAELATVKQQRDDLVGALETLRPRVKDDYDRLFIDGALAKVTP